MNLRTRYPLVFCLLFVFLCLAPMLWGCGGGPAPEAAEISQAAADSSADPDASKQAAEEEPAIAVKVSAVEQRPLASVYTTSATLRADKRAVVISRTTGVIEELKVEEGDRVRKHQPLAVLENIEQQIAWDAARNNMETLQHQFERAERLREQQLLSEEEFEAKRRAADQARQDANLAKLTLERTVIRAPFSGRILVRHLDVGATVSNSTAVYDLADLDPLYADVSVPERHVARLSPGQNVRLAADAAGQEVEGSIERIGHQVDPSTATVKVVVAVPPNEGLRPGAFVRVEILTDVHPKALVVPRSALIAEGRRWFMFRLQEDGIHVDKLEATLGYEERDLVEILAITSAVGSTRLTPGGSTELTPGGAPETAGLAPGDRIVSTGSSALSDGTRITLESTLTGPKPASGSATPAGQ